MSAEKPSCRDVEVRNCRVELSREDVQPFARGFKSMVTNMTEIDEVEVSFIFYSFVSFRGNRIQFVSFLNTRNSFTDL